MESESNIRYKLHQTINPLASYAELPNTRYEDQEPGEEVEILLRRHFITNSGWIVLTIIGMFVPLLIHVAQPSTWMGLEWLSSIPQQTIGLAAIFWYLMLAAYALTSFLNWYYNVFLVTSERLVDVDFLGLLQYSSSEAALHQIQDVEHRQGGLWQLLFNYGTVEAQTAGSVQNIIFEKIPKPSRVTDIITDLLPQEHDIRESTDVVMAPQPVNSPEATNEAPQQ